MNEYYKVRGQAYYYTTSTGCGFFEFYVLAQDWKEAAFKAKQFKNNYWKQVLTIDDVSLIDKDKIEKLLFFKENNLNDNIVIIK